MRLRRLHLTRYGGFSDAVLDLPRSAGADVTVVLGANEAGKSTAFAAWLDVLFGIARRNSPAAWRFPRRELDIAAEIEASSGIRHLRRLPTDRDALRDADNSPVPEGEVAALLHGLTRDGYRTRFSLDREMLERGGQDIANGKGDLGDLLFAGMAGLPGIQGALDETRAAADAFHRLGGRRTRTSALGAGLAELTEAEAVLKTRLTPDVQARYDAAVAEAEGVQRTADEVLAAARRATACERDAVVLREIDARLDTLSTKLDVLPRCTWSSEEAEAARAALREAERTKEARTRADEAVKHADAALAECVPAPGEGIAAAVIAALGALHVEGASVLDRLGAANDADLRRITERRRDAAEAIAAARDRFGLYGAAKGLADRIEPALRAAGDAATEANRTARDAEDAAAALKALPPPPETGDTSALRDALDTLHSLDLAALRKDRDAKAEALERIAPGGPVPDDLPDPHHLRAEITRHRDAASAFATAERAQEEVRVALDARRRAAEVARSAEAGADPSAVETTRQARDGAWHRHRMSLDEASADAFEKAMAAHDRLVAGLAAAATRAEAAHAAGQALAETEALHEARVTATKAAAEALAARDLAPFAARLGLPEDTAPEALLPPLEALREGNRIAPAAARAEAALAEGEATRDRMLDRLRRLLPDAPAPDPEEAARTRLRAVEAAAEAKGRFESTKTAFDRARQAQVGAEAASKEAERRLAQERTVAGLGGEITVADLSALRALEAAEARDAEDAHRQFALLRAREVAAPELDRLAELGVPGPDIIAFARVRASADRDAAQARLAATKARDAAADALSTAKQDQEHAAGVLAAALRGQGGEGLPGERVAALSDAARLRAERDAARDEADGIARRHDPVALATARALPPDPARLGALEDAMSEAEKAHRASIVAAHEARRKRNDAQGGEAAAFAAQSRATVLADLREGARRAAAALVGHMAGKAALARLVQENRGPMVAAASEAFRRITGGEWDGLDVFGPDGMTLMACVGDRRAPVDSLSEGARAQLFLSLRVAGHAAFCKRHGPLPFVTDDILEAFDNTRAETALRMAGEMGMRGQVIFFTHHEHIAALARTAIPNVTVAEMPRQGV